MDFVEAIGWAAAAFTLGAFSMRTMIPLRVAAIASNLCFIAYGAGGGLTPVLALHSVLLPFNIWRLFEILRSLRRATRGKGADLSLDWLRPMLTPVTLEEGTTLFRKGDPADYLYLVDRGEIALDGIDVTLGPGEILGEIAFFTGEKSRTLTATAKTRARVLRMDERDFTRAYYQNPAFGMQIMRLTTGRLLEGMERHPEAYLTRPPPGAS